MIQKVEAGRSLAHGVVTDMAATLSEQISRGVTTIHMDVSRVVDFDGQSLEALLEFNELARTRGLSFILIQPSELLATALDITGLAPGFEILDQAPPVASRSQDKKARAPQGSDA